MKIKILLLALLSLPIYAQEITSLNFDVRIDVENSKVSSDGYADVDFKDNDRSIYLKYFASVHVIPDYYHINIY